MRRIPLPGDQRGAVAVLFAAGATALLPLAFFMLEVSNVGTAQRALQGAADLAAIAAATDLPNAQAAAAANAVANGYQSGEVNNVTLGQYTADPTIPVTSRFVSAPLQSANAAQITLNHSQPLIFGSFFGLSNAAVPLVAHATAAQTRVVSFGIGTTVASLNGGLLNAILGATLGAQVSLSVLDYEALLSAQVDLFALANAMATRQGLVGATYGQAFGSTVPIETFLLALQQVAPGASSILGELAAAAAGSSATVDLTSLIGFGPYASQPISTVEPQLTATASALTLLQGASQTNGTPHLIALSLNPSIPGIASVTADLTIGEPAQKTTVIGIGLLGTILHSAQVRLYLNITLASTVLGAAVQLPLYLEVGYGTAVLSALSCSALDSSQTQVTLNVTPGLLNGWIGSVTPAAMTDYTTEPSPGPATLLSLPSLLTVTGQANAEVVDTGPTAVVYSATDIQNDVVKTTDTTDFAGSLVASLIGNLSLKVNALGLGVGTPPGLTSALSMSLSDAVSPVDQLITAVTQTLGIGLGEASAWVSGASCTASNLVG
jgi:uncharacterized membrane protein